MIHQILLASMILDCFPEAEISEPEAVESIQDQQLTEHEGYLHRYDSESNSYLVDDYPYGFRLRTKIRYWIEYRPNNGFRFVSQTLNPKTHRWNEPKRSTYYKLGMAMYINDKGHVDHAVVSEYSNGSEILKFATNFPRAVSEDLKIYTKMAARHRKMSEYYSEKEKQDMVDAAAFIENIRG